MRTPTTTRPTESYDAEVPIFSTGWHLGREWSLADLNAMQRNAELFAGRIIPPLGIGHGELRVLPHRGALSCGEEHAATVSPPSGNFGNRRRVSPCPTLG